VAKKILVGGWFDLPRLGRDVFAVLMKQGVVYDKSMGFKVDSATDLQAAVRTLRAATGEEVELTLRCYICGKVACPGCPYLESCDRASVSTLCLCSDHAPEKSVYGAYTKTFDVALRA
jgi:hypothetical protein